MADIQENFKRVEMKYLLTDRQYRALREWMEGRFVEDMYGETDILNIYYDTPDFRLIRASLEKPVYKEKLRLRSYNIPENGTSPAFVEIKKKYNGIVYKRRVKAELKGAEGFLNQNQPLPNQSQITKEIEGFLQQYPGIGPRMAVSYRRIAMEGIGDYAQSHVRITFDTRIRWRIQDLNLRVGPRGEELLGPGEHLMEVKIMKAFPMELSRVFSELGIYQTSYSKYGAGYLSLLKKGREAVC